MRIRVGYELIYDCPQPTPMMLMLHIHHTRAPDIIVPDQVTTNPLVPVASYRDGFGNWCSRLVAPTGQMRIISSAILHDNGAPDPINSSAHQHPVQELPAEVLVFLGRDAVDVAISNTFGPNTLTSFKVWTDEVEEEFAPGRRHSGRRCGLLRLLGSVLVANSCNLKIGCCVAGLQPLRSSLLGLLGFAVGSFLPLGHGDILSCCFTHRDTTVHGNKHHNLLLEHE